MKMPALEGEAGKPSALGRGLQTTAWRGVRLESLTYSALGRGLQTTAWRGVRLESLTYSALGRGLQTTP